MTRTIRKKRHLPVKLISIIPAVLFLVFIFGMMVKTTSDAVNATVRNTECSFEGIMELSDGFEETLQGECYQKQHFINLNGLTTRLLGINTLNERQKMKGGFLSYEEEETDITVPLKRVIGLNDFLAERGVRFLYVLAPTASSIYDAQFAPGYENNSWKNIENMIEGLSEAGVNTINVDALYKEKGLHSQDVLFKTDHHWTPEGAFFATHKSLQYMRDTFGIVYDDSMADFSGWDVVSYEDYFLGSHGKNVGTEYAGTDDISLIRRKGQGNIPISYLRTNTTTWEYRDSLFSESELAERDYYNRSPYEVYIGGNYPLAVIRNDQALNQKRIAVIGDSYRLPVETYLASYFTEIYHIDMRNYTDGTAAQLLEAVQPDVVLMYTYEYGLTKHNRYEFGVEEYQAARKAFPNPAEISTLRYAHLDAGDDDGQFQVIFSNLEPDTPYTLTIENADLQGGQGAYIQMTLQDLTDNHAVCNRYFEVGSRGSQQWLFTTGEEEHTYAVYMYAGTRGHTAGVSASVEGIQLQTGFPRP